MTTESDDELRPPIDGYREPPPFPAESLWAGIEAGAAEDPLKRLGSSDRRTVRLPAPWAAAAALALLAGGAAVGSLLSGADGMIKGGEATPRTGSQIVPESSAEPADDDARHVVWL